MYPKFTLALLTFLITSFVSYADATKNTIPILDPSKGQEIGSVYEAFLSPHQEPGEEKDTPALVPKVFQSTAPSLLRSERNSRGHGVIRFTKDLSKVYVDVKVENVSQKTRVSMEGKELI